MEGDGRKWKTGWKRGNKGKEKGQKVVGRRVGVVRLTFVGRETKTSRSTLTSFLRSARS